MLHCYSVLEVLNIGSSLPPITSSLPKPFGDLAPPKSTDQAPSESVTPGSRKSMLYNGGGNFVELLEDMDTSESEHSDCEVDDDVDWKYSSLDVGDESGWAHAEAKGRRRKTKRKMSKPGRHSVAQSNSNYFDDPENGPSARQLNVSVELQG
ncbi:hypothetical protein POM88_048128 [Heracleum sosnowskyi]|uniref:Uncharacterized protein n=1 Tax=Heracleum sosnowskyi TaxID=360622 RepID=A0AAD8M097_9APIA|nr:hypothetical protein POM88_048128 [Heracleum sosnowskyi]